MQISRSWCYCRRSGQTSNSRLQSGCKAWMNVRKRCLKLQRSTNARRMKSDKWVDQGSRNCLGLRLGSQAATKQHLRLVVVS